MRRGFTFEFQEPQGWDEINENGRLIFHGPSGEELIVSGWTVACSGASCDFSLIRQQLLENALAAMRYAVDLPDVTTVSDMTKKTTQSGLSRWDALAKTLNGEIEFYQSAVEGLDGVLLVTFETPAGADRSQFFEQFMSEIHAVGHEHGN